MLTECSQYEIEAPPNNQICDVCSTIPIYAVFDCRDFLHGESGTTSEGAWEICRGCADLVSAEDWDGLVERLIEVFNRKYGSIVPDDLLRPQLVEIVNSFRSLYSKPS